MCVCVCVCVVCGVCGVCVCVCVVCVCGESETAVLLHFTSLVCRLKGCEAALTSANPREAGMCAVAFTSFNITVHLKGI